MELIEAATRAVYTRRDGALLHSYTKRRSQKAVVNMFRAAAAPTPPHHTTHTTKISPYVLNCRTAQLCSRGLLVRWQ